MGKGGRAARATRRGMLVMVVLGAPLAAGWSAWSAPAAAGPVAEQRAAHASSARSAVGCERDVAADLRWVSWLYRAFLGRDASLAEAAARLPSMQAGSTYRDIAASVATSNEARRRIVRDAYDVLLHRAPAAAELAAWTPWVSANGASRLAAALAGSDEAFERAGGTARGWLDQAYRDILGRPADGSGLAYWGGRLAAGTSRDQVALALWDSAPRVRLRVDAVYRAVLGRPADPGGASYWSPVAVSRGDTELGLRLAITQAAWDRAQRAFGGTASPMPPPCPPPVPRWVPPAGAVVRNLSPVAHLGPKLVALTFDDGPDATWTPQVLDVLRRERVPATFFFVGDQVRRRPELVRRVVDEGHRPAVHTMNHPNLLTLGRSSQRSQIVDAADLIEDITGAGTVRCFRPPYGNYDATTLQLARDRGLATILWSRDGRDWATPGVSTIVDGNLDTRYDAGRGVVLLHDGGGDRSQTVAALSRLIQAYRDRGYRFVQLC